MVPMCVILFVSPRGSSTTVYVIAVIFVNKFTEQIIWLVALVSKTHHYKKFILLRWVKTTAKAQKSTAKGTFDLQRQVLLQWFSCHYCGAAIDLLRCRYRSIAVVTKSTAIDLPFSSAFALLWRVENRHHMRLPFGSSDLYSAGYARCQM